jgi:hypothetical protein
MESCILGIPSRTGPEADLVQRFVLTSLLELYQEGHRIVFIEPALETKRPDIVLVSWNPSIAARWPKERRLLKLMDLRLAQLLLLKGALPEEELQVHFPHTLKASLGRLDRAEIIDFAEGVWALRDLNDIFAVQQIVSVEAKISALSRALEQARFNTWFSSESYILTSVQSPRAQIVERAKSHGVGLWSFPEGTHLEPIVGAREHPLPQSFASWVFNERVWKVSLGV